ncbi:MAG: 4Fe-4S binding protein [Clostridia bacterium]
MFEKTGIQDPEKILEKFPSIERINKGPVAIAECFAKIPCNPCETACAFSAITIGADINNLPTVNFNNCTGCGVCLSKCPGLAIMVIDGSKSSKSIEMRLPYEFLPLPKIGDTVRGLDREGRFVCISAVKNVQNPKAFDRTPIITIEVPREHMYTVRSFSLEDK